MTETTVLYRVQCAVITHGCPARLVLDGPVNIDLEHLDREVPEDRRVDDLLALNGWRLDYGRWVCPAHPRVVP